MAADPPSGRSSPRSQRGAFDLAVAGFLVVVLRLGTDGIDFAPDFLGFILVAVGGWRVRATMGMRIWGPALGLAVLHLVEFLGSVFLAGSGRYDALRARHPETSTSGAGLWLLDNNPSLFLILVGLVVVATILIVWHWCGLIRRLGAAPANWAARAQGTRIAFLVVFAASYVFIAAQILDRGSFETALAGGYEWVSPLLVGAAWLAVLSVLTMAGRRIRAAPIDE